VTNVTEHQQFKQLNLCKSSTQQQENTKEQINMTLSIANDSQSNQL